MTSVIHGLIYFIIYKRQMRWSCVTFISDSTINRLTIGRLHSEPTDVYRSKVSKSHNFVEKSVPSLKTYWPSFVLHLTKDGIAITNDKSSLGDVTEWQTGCIFLFGRSCLDGGLHNLIGIAFQRLRPWTSHTHCGITVLSTV